MTYTLQNKTNQQQSTINNQKKNKKHFWFWFLGLFYSVFSAMRLAAETLLTLF